MPTNDDLFEIGERHLSDAKRGLEDALGDDAGPVVRAVTDALHHATRHTAPVADQVADALSNDMLPMEARQRLASEAREAGAAMMKDGTERASAAIEIAKKKLEVAAIPPVPKASADVALLRDEVRMVLDSASNPLDAAVALAQGNDRNVAGIIASSWGERLLATKGVKDAGATLRAATIEGSRQHGVDRQKAAAQALADGGALTSLGKAQGALIAGVASMHLDDAEER